MVCSCHTDHPFLLFQPFIYQLHHLLLFLFGQCADACPMASAGLYEYMDVLLPFQPGHSGSRPRVVLAVDEYHFRVILFQEFRDLLA